MVLASSPVARTLLVFTSTATTLGSLIIILPFLSQITVFAVPKSIPISLEKIITLSLLLEHKAGVLSKVLNTIATDSGSIMTINQGIPLQGVANTTISIETKFLTIDLEALLDKIRLIDGVKRLELLGQVD